MSAVDVVMRGIREAMGARFHRFGGGWHVQARTENQLDRLLQHSAPGESLVLDLPADEFRDYLQDTLARGTTCVAELATYHAGRPVRIRCQDGARFRIMLDGTVEWKP